MWRSMDNLLVASDIGDISSSFGYDYTDQNGTGGLEPYNLKAAWTGPYESSLTGHSMVTYSVLLTTMSLVLTFGTVLKQSTGN